MRIPRSGPALFLSFLLHPPLALAEAGPVTKGPWLGELGPTSVVVKVETNYRPVRLEVKEAQGASLRLEDKDPTAFHSLTVQGLKPSTRYVYTLESEGTRIEGTFVTAPAVEPAVPFSFVAYGDNRTDPSSHSQVVSAIAARPSDFLIHTGDYVQTGGSDADWQAFFQIEKPLLKDRALFGAVGNHELYGSTGEIYARYLGLPGADSKRLYSTFRWATARFFLLNGEDTWASGPERDWLEKELARSREEPGLLWRFVVIHHGPWSSGPHGPNPRLASAGFPALLAKHGVHLVIAGHDHLYERGFGDGIRYVVTGGGGAPLYSVGTRSVSVRKVEAAHHFVEFRVEPDSLRMTARRLDGTAIESCGFLRDAPAWDCDPTPPKPAPPPVVESRAAPSPTPTSRCSCRVGGSSARPTCGEVFLFLIVAALFPFRYSRSRCRRPRSLASLSAFSGPRCWSTAPHFETNSPAAKKPSSKTNTNAP